VPKPLIINTSIENDHLFNTTHRVVDAAKHARRLLGPRLGFTEAIDRFTGHQGLSNMDRLYGLARREEIGMAVIAEDPAGHEAGLVVAEKGVTAISDKATKTGIFITAWFVGKPKYEKELSILLEEGVELARQMEAKLDIDETHEGVFVLERVKKDQPESNSRRFNKLRSIASNVIEAPVDETALDVLHDVVEGVGFTAISTTSWTRDRAVQVIKKDEYGNPVKDEKKNIVKEFQMIQSSPYLSTLYSIE
jgi:hypothetical protein